jgi:transposase
MGKLLPKTWEKNMAKIYIVDLNAEEKEQLLELTSRGQAPARKMKRAQIMLLADAGKKDETIVEMLHVGRATVERIRKRFVLEGMTVALNERSRPGGQRKLGPKGEAVLETLAKSEPPEGRTRWTMQLLAKRLVELKVVDSISDETVRKVLKKSASNPG